jgi:PAS domain S-box-containing protein
MRWLLRNIFLTVSVLFGTLIFVAIFYYGYWNGGRLTNSFAWIEHTQEVMIEAQELKLHIKDVHVQSRSYLVTGNEDYILEVPHHQAQVQRHLAKLRELVLDSLQIRRTDTIAALIGDQGVINDLRKKGSDVANADHERIRELFENSKKQEIALMTLLDRFYDEELVLLKKRKLAGNEDRNALRLVLIGVLSLVAILLFIILLNYRRNQRLKDTVIERNESLERSLKEVSAYKYALDESAIVAITDQRGVIKHVNENFCKISKYNRNELMGQDHRIINSAFHSKEYISNIWATIANGKVWKGELRNQAKDGTIYWVDTSIVPFLNNHGKPYQYVAIRSDITERKKTEEVRAENAALQKEMSSYKYALDESAIVAITDQRGIIQHVNDNFCRISKYSRNELIGQDHRIINSGYHPKDFIRNIWTTIARGKVWKGELCNKAKDGSTYWVDTSIVPFLNDHGKPYQYVAIRSDITERKKSEEIFAKNVALETEVKEKRAELAGIFERITDGFIVLDKNFVYLYANRKVEEMTGKKIENLIGKSVWEIFPDAVGSETHRAFNKAMIDQKYSAHFDYYQPLDLWQENHIYPSENGLSVFIRDVTAQKRAEQKLIESERIYKTIASNIPGSAILLLDRDYRYFLIEGDMVEKVGFSRDDLIFNKMQDVLPAKNFEETKKHIDRALRGETFSVEIARAGYDLFVRYVPLRNEENQVNATMIVVIDVTDLKRAEKEIVELNTNLEQKINERTQQLAAANKELESFSYSVAHDLRTPLRAVSGYANMLVEDYQDKLDEEGKRLLGEMEYNTRKMGTLIDDLLTFSRLGRKEVNKSLIDMKSLIETVSTDLDDGKTNFNFGQLFPVLADEALIRHVLTNLISNAIKYSGKKEHPQVSVKSIQQGSTVTYSISDNGVGFDMQFADKLFGVFQRLHSQEEFDGTGVGLAIVQRIINRHGGKVWANAELNKGATFSFSLEGSKKQSSEC